MKCHVTNPIKRNKQKCYFTPYLLYNIRNALSRTTSEEGLLSAYVAETLSGVTFYPLTRHLQSPGYKSQSHSVNFIIYLHSLSGHRDGFDAREDISNLHYHNNYLTN